jgi:N6-L-threonylcarbamoyladenine synthase
MIILAIETSCDETAAAIVKTGRSGVTILSEAVSSQIKIHAGWGGVVPNLAAREHLKNLMPLLDHILKKAGIKHEDIGLMAATSGPGLIPALLIGSNAAKTLSWLWKKPLLDINHIEGHIYSNFISHPALDISFPILCLVVSGGHTQLVLVKDHLKYKVIGETLDDAAGEAFDKVARILGLGYPGGPIIAKMAAKFPISNLQFPKKFKIQLPRPMINSRDFNFSFSGLKTAVLYLVKKIPPSHLSLLTSRICHEFQQAVIDVLVAKTLRAAQKYKLKTIMLSGGVSANRELRGQLRTAIAKLKNIKYRIPDTRHSIDNAAMIAAAAYYRWQKMNEAQRKKCFLNWKEIKTDANLRLI